MRNVVRNDVRNVVTTDMMMRNDVTERCDGMM